VSARILLGFSNQSSDLGQDPKVFDIESSDFQADFDAPYFIPGISSWCSKLKTGSDPYRTGQKSCTSHLRTVSAFIEFSSQQFGGVESRMNGKRTLQNVSEESASFSGKCQKKSKMQFHARSQGSSTFPEILNFILSIGLLSAPLTSLDRQNWEFTRQFYLLRDLSGLSTWRACFSVPEVGSGCGNTGPRLFNCPEWLVAAVSRRLRRDSVW
jgi:hypothetical protein